MSKVEIEIPDDRWLQGELGLRPQDKQLCVVIPKIVSKFPMICQWRWGTHNPVGIDAFCDITERFYYKNNDIAAEGFIPLYFSMSNIDRWKPLRLPKDVEERVLVEIEKWFEGVLESE